PPLRNLASRKLLDQLEADQPGTPGRVLPLQFQGGSVDGWRRLGSFGTAVGVVGVQPLPSLLLIAVPPAAHRAIWHLQGDGNLGQRLALLVALNDLFAEGEGPGL